MKKFIIILLLSIIANPIFAMENITIKKTININISETTTTNLQSAAKLFSKEIETLKEECKTDLYKNENFCKELNFPQTEKIKNIKFTTPTTENDFLEIVKFYEELTKFKNIQLAKTDFENTKKEATKQKLIAQINILKNKIETQDLKKLIKQINDENLLINTLLTPNKTTDIDKLNENKTEILAEEIKPINTKLQNLKSKYKSSNISISTHNNTDIKLPNIDNITNMNEDELKNLENNLTEISEEINTQLEIVEKNISELQKLKNSNEINKKLDELKKEKQNQSELLKQLGKNINITNGNSENENNKLDTLFPQDAKGSTYKKSNYIDITKDNSINKLEEEIAQVKENNNLLTEYINKKLTECKEILYQLIKPDTTEVNTLQECQQQVKNKEDDNKKIAEKIQNNFKDLIKKIAKISELEKIIYGIDNQFSKDITDPFEYKLLGYSKMGGEGIKYRKEISDKYPELKERLLFSTIQNIINKEINKNEILSNKLLITWNEYIGKVNEQANTNISNMENYIKELKLSCMDWNNEDWKNKGKDKDNIPLQTEVNACLENMKKSQKCNEFVAKINTLSSLKNKLKNLLFTKWTKEDICIKELNQNNCQAYIDASNAKINISDITKSSEIDNLEYLNECIEKTNNYFDPIEYNNKRKEELNTLNQINNIKDQILNKLEKHPCNNNEENKTLCNNDTTLNKNNLNNTILIINRNIDTIKNIIETENIKKECLNNLNIRLNNIYLTKTEATQECLNEVKKQCNNKDYNWSNLTIENAKIKTKECKESNKNEILEYLTNNFTQICQIYKDSATIKSISTGSLGRYNNDSSYNDTVINSTKAEENINNNSTEINNYAQNIAKYCRINNEDININKKCYENPFKRDGKIATLNKKAIDTILPILKRKTSMLCGQEITLRPSKTISGKEFKEPICKYANIISNGCK